MGKCQKWDCVWHGVELSGDAAFCEYCNLHLLFNIPNEPKDRRAAEPGETCDKYRPGDSFEYIETIIRNGKAIAQTRTCKRKWPTKKRLQAFFKSQETAAHERAVREANIKRLRERETRQPASSDIQDLWRRGLSDAAIARELDCMPSRVRLWREQNGLSEGTHGKRTKLDVDEFERYYGLGLSDPEIALLLAVSTVTVAQHRREVGLPPNYAAGENRKCEITQTL